MININATQARNKLYSLIASANENNEIISISSKKGNAILIGEEDWKAIEETLYLYSIPNMVESIVESLKEKNERIPLEKVEW